MTLVKCMSALDNRPEREKIINENTPELPAIFAYRYHIPEAGSDSGNAVYFYPYTTHDNY
jgi:hypothetical protein